MIRYKYEPPKYFRDSKVSFIDRSGHEKVGLIDEVWTIYDALNMAIHMYQVVVENNINRNKISEEKIICKLS